LTERLRETRPMPRCGRKRVARRFQIAFCGNMENNG
jgi:hypothetical protein